MCNVSSQNFQARENKEKESYVTLLGPFVCTKVDGNWEKSDLGFCCHRHAAPVDVGESELTG